MSFICRLWGLIFSNKRSECEIRRERQFIEAVNSLKTLSVTDRGGMSIDPEEMRDLITELRENYKHLVDPAYRKPPAGRSKD